MVLDDVARYYLFEIVLLGLYYNCWVLSFENMELSVQGLKFLFLCNLLTWTELFIGESLMSIIDFID